MIEALEHTQPVLYLGVNNPKEVARLQALLNMILVPRVSVDGSFGTETLKAVVKFQRTNGLGVDGVVGNKTWTVLTLKTGKNIISKYLTEKDYEDVARELGVNVATIKAVVFVESAGEGFLGERPIVVFEGHWFWRLLESHGIDPEPYRVGNEDILYPKWDKRYHLGTMSEYKQLSKARKLHNIFTGDDKNKISYSTVEDLAEESCSWGMFQVMGFNWKDLGYSSVTEFVDKMFISEREHLNAFVRFVKHKKIVDELQRRDWAGFARVYNGPAYASNNYHVKLEVAYRRYNKV